MSSPPRKRGKATAQTPPTPPTARAAPNLAKRAASLLPPPNASATRQRREKAGVPAQRLGQGDGFGGVRDSDWDSTTRDADDDGGGDDDDDDDEEIEEEKEGATGGKVLL